MSVSDSGLARRLGDLDEVSEVHHGSQSTYAGATLCDDFTNDHDWSGWIISEVGKRHNDEVYVFYNQESLVKGRLTTLQFRRPEDVEKQGADTLTEIAKKLVRGGVHTVEKETLDVDGPSYEKWRVHATLETNGTLGTNFLFENIYLYGWEIESVTPEGRVTFKAADDWESYREAERAAAE